MPDSPSARTPAARRPSLAPSTPKGWTPFEERGADQIGLVLAERFRIVERIGRGGMGSVYLAEDLALRSRAAVKLLRTDDPDARRRFLEEAMILANLRHPHLVQVLAVGEADDGTPFMAMEHLGQSLEARLRNSGGPLPWREVVECAVQAAAALSVLHQAGVIHRDIKPSNIAELRGATGRPLVKLIDLGVARVEDWARVQGGGPSLPPRAPTRDGKVIGTPGFVPPESGLCRADPRFDVYGLGVTIFKLVTGVMPDPSSPRTMREARVGLDVPDDLEALVAGAIAVLPEERIASADELRRRLAAIRTIHADEREPLLFDGCYELLEVLGVGAFAEVHRAYNRVTRRYVALKILRPEVRGDQKARRRLDREARALTALRHPGIPALLDGRTDPDQRRPFIAMTLAKGTRASEFCLTESRLSPREVVAVGLQVADALARMHGRGILHRDLSASNVLLDRGAVGAESPAATLIDLGMVIFEDRFYADVVERYPTPPEARTREDGDGLDLLAWTAPEARVGKGWAGRSDVYSLGILLFRLLTGKLPTRDEGGRRVSPDELVDECPRPLGHAILAAIEEDPARRLDAVGLREALLEVAAEMDGEEAEEAPGVGREPDVASGTPRSGSVKPERRADAGPGARWFLSGFAVAMLVVLAWVLGRESGMREDIRVESGGGEEVVSYRVPSDRVRPSDAEPAATPAVGSSGAGPGPEERSERDAGVDTDRANSTSTQSSITEAGVVAEAPSATTDKSMLSSAEVRQRLRTRAGELDACLRGAPPVRVKLSIQASGQVAKIEVDGASPMVELCVRDVLGAVEFPASDRRSTHRLTLGGR
ncbi:MAG: protein kinase [Nannocystaceae bacterium]